VPPPRADRQRDGAVAEDAACAMLQARGMQLLARNARYPFGELDLVMRDQGTLVFVEVRLRQDARFGGAAVSVDAAKRRKLALAAEAWRASHRDHANAPCRFDVVAVVRSDTGLTCEWLPAAFTLDDI
jgi:putative endonuclease